MNLVVGFKVILHKGEIGSPELCMQAELWLHGTVGKRAFLTEVKSQNKVFL